VTSDAIKLVVGIVPLPDADLKNTFIIFYPFDGGVRSAVFDVGGDDLPQAIKRACERIQAFRGNLRTAKERFRSKIRFSD